MPEGGEEGEEVAPEPRIILEKEQITKGLSQLSRTPGRYKITITILSSKVNSSDLLDKYYSSNSAQSKWQPCIASAHKNEKRRYCMRRHFSLARECIKMFQLLK